jgi:hypothetical protein
MDYASLSAPLVIDASSPHSTVTISASSTQRVEINKPLSSLTIKDCAELSMYVNAPIEQLIVFQSKQTDLNIEARVAELKIENSERTELHFAANAHFGLVTTAASKGTTVCLPEACNMVPANKEGKVLTVKLSADGQNLDIQ